MTFRPSDRAVDAALAVTTLSVPAGTTLDALYEQVRGTIIVDDGTVRPETTKEEFAQEYARMLRSAARVVTRSGCEAASVQIDGAQARWLGFTHVPRGRTDRLVGRAHVVLSGDRGWIVWCEVREPLYSRIEPICERSTRSVRLLAR